MRVRERPGFEEIVCGVENNRSAVSSLHALVASVLQHNPLPWSCQKRIGNAARTSSYNS